MAVLTLKIATPSRSLPELECDSVHLTASDGSDGRGGGSCGIRPGHTASLIGLAEGELTAFRGGAVLLRAHCGAGFAAVKNDAVTVAVESFEEID